MSITCKFELSRSSNIYYSGEEIAGLLTICCLKKCQIDVILLEFYGNSTVQWWEIDKSEENIIHNDFSIHDISDKILCRQQQKHVCEQLKLDALRYKQLQPHVEYTFRWSFQIPQQVPATLNCIYGQTEYGLRLQVQRTKKANKEFNQRIIVRNKLDLTPEITYKNPYVVYHFNDYGHIKLQLPCTGFTPGQKIPYHFKYQTTQKDCKLFVQLICYTTCRIQNNCNGFKKIKQIINFKKHLSTENSSFVNIPLHCHTSSINDPELLIKNQYFLEVSLIHGYKKVLLRVSIPLIIGTTPCYVFDADYESFMCFNNRGLTLKEYDDTHNCCDLVDRYNAGAYKIVGCSDS